MPMDASQDRNARLFLARGAGVAWTLVMIAVFVAGARDHYVVSSSRSECGSDPHDILRAGELLERSSLHLIVQAHCGDARYLPDGRIALRFGGGPIDVETRKVDIAGAAYVRIVSIGGSTLP